MTRFVAFEPPNERGGPPAGVSERAVFVRDAFSIWGFLLPLFWLLRYGLFVSALAVCLLCVGLWRMAETGYGLLAVPLLLLLGLLVALEGPSLRARRFLRKGYAETAALEAEDEAEAAILYYAATGLSAAPGGRASPEALPWRFEAANAPRRNWWPWRRTAGAAS